MADVFRVRRSCGNCPPRKCEDAWTLDDANRAFEEARNHACQCQHVAVAIDGQWEPAEGMTMWVFVARWERNGPATGFVDDLGNPLGDDELGLLAFLQEAWPEEEEEQYEQMGLWDDADDRGIE